MNTKTQSISFPKLQFLFQPDEALAKALEHLASDDWEKNVDGEIPIHGFKPPQKYNSNHLKNVVKLLVQPFLVIIALTN